jgi:putative Holliday junction resolvase
LPIDYQDERLTTVMAHDVLSGNNVRGKKRKQTVDAVSAVMILQSYIDKK